MLWCDLYLNGYKTYSLNDILYLYRVNDSDYKKRKIGKRIDSIKACLEYYPKIGATLFDYFYIIKIFFLACFQVHLLLSIERINIENEAYMKKILHVFSVMDRGGAETFTMNVYRNINKKKYQFDFLCLSKKNGAYENEIRQLGGTINHTKHSPKNVPMLLFEVVRMLKKNKYDSIHITVGFYSGIICMCAKIAGIKNIIVHSHSAGDDNQNSIFRKMYFNFMRYLINKTATYKLSCGIEAGRFLFGNKQRFEVIYNSIDLDVFKPSNAYKKEIKKGYNLNDSIIIGEVARFSKVKNHMFFIKLGKYIKNNKLNIKIVLVGDGDLKNQIFDEITINELNDIIILTGNSDKVYKFLNAFDVLLMPSFYEGFPVSVVESLACGTPCLLSNNISKEAAIIEKMVVFLDINCSESEWIENVISLSHQKKDFVKYRKVLFDKGFDITSCVSKLEKIYNNE